MNKRQFKIHAWKNDGFYYYGISADAWWKIVLDCHDKASYREEFASLLEEKILLFHKQDPSSVKLVCSIGKPLLEDIYRGPSYALYHRLVKRCEKHYCVQNGTIERLPQYDSNLYRERYNTYQCTQRDKFFSRHRDCAS